MFSLDEDELPNISEFDVICRICLRKDDLQCIYNFQDKIYPLENKDLSGKMRLCATINIESNDGLPSNICEMCSDSLLSAYEYKLLSEKSDGILRNALEISKQKYGKNKCHKISNLEFESEIKNINCNSKEQCEPKTKNKSNLRNNISSISHESENKNYTNKSKYRNFEVKENIDCVKKESSGSETNKENGLEFYKELGHCENSTLLQSRNPTFEAKFLDENDDFNIDLDDNFEFNNMDDEIKADEDLEESLGLTLLGNDCKKQNEDVIVNELTEDNLDNYGDTNTCHVCTKQLHSKSSLDKHMAALHRTEERIGFKCYGCDEVLQSRWERELHEDLHCPSMPPGTVYQCRLCPATALSRDEFDRHIWNKHKGGAPPPARDPRAGRTGEHVCEICGKIFRSVFFFDRHRETHTGNSVWYHCDLCDYRATNNRSLTVHRLRHEGRKPFACRLCPYKTERIDYLRIHDRRHSGLRPYACTLCDYRAVNHSNLKKHRTKHTNMGEYECESCGKFYKSNQDLKWHTLRVHQQVKMFYCRPCGTKYVGEEALNRHLLKKHNTNNSA